MGVRTWSTGQTITVRRLWRDGLSASEIATVVGKSRSATIAKIHRLGAAKRKCANSKFARRLSLRERRMIAQGASKFSLAEIAARFAVSPSTVVRCKYDQYVT